mmetsp:Transcript_11583/g.49412  ORF Transcript_11583/g.49412 Transcript_11583/m.49412 type:complete len:333 (+) Transcript_11583:1180-2178(+)
MISPRRERNVNVSSSTLRGFLSRKKKSGKGFLHSHGCAKTSALSGVVSASSESPDSASLSAQPYSSSSGRHANLCCSLQSAPWHDRLQYRTRPQHEHRRNSCRRVSTRPHNGCEHDVVPRGSVANGRDASSTPSPYQSSKNRFSQVAVRCACAAVFAASATSAAAATAALSVLMSLRLRRRSSTTAAARDAATTAASNPFPARASISAASFSSLAPSTESCSTPKPSCKQCPSSLFAETQSNRMFPRAHKAAPASGSLSRRRPPEPLKCITAKVWCASLTPAVAARASKDAPRARRASRRRSSSLSDEQRRGSLSSLCVSSCDVSTASDPSQ